LIAVITLQQKKEESEEALPGYKVSLFHLNWSDRLKQQNIN